MTLKLPLLTVTFIIAFSLLLAAKEKSSQEAGKQVKKNSKEVQIFDSCDKDNASKCEQNKKTPATDYSKFLK